MKEGRAAWPSLAMAQQQIDRLWEELHQLEQRIEEWEVKIDEAIENDKLQNVIDSCKKEKAWLVRKMKDLWQQLSALKAQLAGPTGEVLAATPMMTGAMTSLQFRVQVVPVR